VYNFFDNLLPDSELIRSRIQMCFIMATKQPNDFDASGHDDYLKNECYYKINFS
jgi:hypothetical protein